MTAICFYSPASRGGAGWFVSALAQAMADAGAQVLLVAPEMVPADREPTGPNVTRRVLIAGKGGRATLVERVGRTLWRIASTFPILAAARLRHREYVITMFDWVPVLVAQLLLLKLIGARVTFVVHDATPHAWAFRPQLRWLERWLYRLSYRLPDRIVSLTRSAQAELAAQWGRRTRSHVIPHGAYVHGSPTPLPGQGGVLVFGMLRRNKRILESIEAMRLLAAEGTGLRLTIAGEPHVDDPEYWQACLAAVAELDQAGYQGIVTVEEGFVAEARVAQLVDACDALLLPYEQFNSQSGVAVLGAMAERMILATRVGGIAELADQGLEAVPIASPVDAAGIAAALRALEVLTPGERRERAARSRRALVKELAWDRIGRDYVSLIAGERGAVDTVPVAGDRTRV